MTGRSKRSALGRDGFERADEDPRRIEVINHQLLKAQAILAELPNGLNIEAGGDFARTMHRLYDYHNRRLLEANVRKQVEPVIEVERLVRDLRDAWAQMLTQSDTRRPQQIRGVG
ncbi:MAG: flagellar export chaperone FliS [Opitutaceae bacterium]